MRPDKDDALRTLQPFQRRTVDHVVDRLLAPGGSRRFLVADEVGLGKTLVARGVIAEFIDRHWDGVKRIDIVYLCSNAALARENLSKIRVGGSLGHVLPATRFTLLPRELEKLHSKLNFISVTPSTALSVQGGGHSEERLVLHQILRDRFDGAWLSNFLKNDVGREKWNDSIQRTTSLNRDLCEKFLKNLENSPDLLARLESMRAPFAQKKIALNSEQSRARYHLLGALRALLARTCIEALEPDLIILDEFQRFKDLLHVSASHEHPSPVAELAQQLFQYTTPENARVAMLLLSATPYRMFTTSEDSATDDHYRDFLDTMRFLLHDDVRFSHLEHTLSEYRSHLNRAARGTPHEAERFRDSLQEQLLQVMTRTERVGSTVERDSMVREPAHHAPVQAQDLRQYVALEKLREQIGTYDLIDLWKSSPYLLNFMKKYKFKEALERQLPKLQGILAQTSETHLSEKQVRQYERIDPGNARLRLLQKETLENEQWKMLWLAPSHPYWPLHGAWEKNRHFTKKLVFSAWNVVPDAVASLLSFEAERLQVGNPDHEYQSLHDKQHSFLTFALKEERPERMTTLALQLPCLRLAHIHPLSFAPGSDVESEMRSRVAELLAVAGIHPSAEAGDQRWYWVALLKLDDDVNEIRTFLHRVAAGELKQSNNADELMKIGIKGLARHAQEAIATLDNRLELGAVPRDLIDVLTEFALGSPSILWARSLAQLGASRTFQRSEGNRLGEGFRSLFREPTVIRMLRSRDEESYWRSTLRYCFEGNLQAVLDEYAHFLWEPATWGDASADQAAVSITGTACSAVTIRTSWIRPDYYSPEASQSSAHIGVAIRNRFALRYGNAGTSGDAMKDREETVRTAFKSPFYPFVLVSTSVGQEGLDFHPWCHAVWHWNLPGNPVDLEQREGRVHRYKGHAVRKNVAHEHGSELHAAWLESPGDPWKILFDLARAKRATGASDLVPCWLAPGPHKVERCIPLLPFSREHERLSQLKRSLAIYRVVFGQPRQEELLRLLSLGQATTQDLEKWVIKLEPPLKTLSYENGPEC